MIYYYLHSIMEDKGPILGYWKIRGLIELAKLIMEYGKKPYQMEYYKQGPAPEWSRAEWLDKKFTLGLDFPNVPYLIDGELKMCESMNIYFYLMKKYVPELLGKTEMEQAKVFEGLCVLKDIKDSITMPCYNPDPTKAPEAVKNIAPKVEMVEKKLGKNEWLIGDTPTVCDLMLMEVTDQFQLITKGEWLKDHPTLEAHNARTKEIPSIKEYKNSPRFFEGPFNNPVASVNNTPEDYWK